MRIWNALSSNSTPWTEHFGSSKCSDGHDTHEVKSIAWLPGDRYLVTGGMDSTLKLWDSRELELGAIATGKGHDDGVTSVAVSPDGTRIVSGGKLTLIVWHSGILGQALGQGTLGQEQIGRGAVQSVVAQKHEEGLTMKVQSIAFSAVRRRRTDPRPRSRHASVDGRVSRGRTARWSPRASVFMKHRARPTAT